MKVTAIAVMSGNGKVAKGQDGDAHSWSSGEDWEHFQDIVSRHDLLVMDSQTYETVKPEPQAERLRVVLTDRPEDYKSHAVAGQLEFMSASPQELLQHMAARGYQKMLLVGGQANAMFFTQGLVDELYVTIEPYVFGSGRNLLDSADFEAALQLQSVKQLNKRGTLVLHYLVDNTKPIA